MIAVAELQSPPRQLIPRVAGRDLRVLVHDDVVYLSQVDVETIAGIPPWGTGEVLIPIDHAALFPYRGTDYVRLDAALARIHQDATAPHEADLLLRWIQHDLPAFTTPDVVALAERPVTTVVGAFTVAGAARQLAARAGVALGRDRLFDHMDRIGWIGRNDASSPWIIAAHPHNEGWLIAKTVTVLSGKKARPYPQVYVTPAGIDALERTLPAQSDRAPAARPAALFD